MFKTPIVLLVFNRVDTLNEIFNILKKLKPSCILVVADGPRSGRLDDIKGCKDVRDLIDSIRWDCDIHKNYSDVNLGCKKRVSTGITWAFNKVSEAIFIEDDCLPDISFFYFAQELLEKYRNDKRINMVNGSNFCEDVKNSDSYLFSKYVDVWGWASWSSRWIGRYDENISDWPIYKKNNEFIPNRKYLKYWRNIFDHVSKGKIDTWDYQFQYMCWKEKSLNIVPSKNLIRNIGFGENATHTTERNTFFENINVHSVNFPLIHPEEIKVSSGYDSAFEEINFPRASTLLKLINKLRSIKINDNSSG